VIGNPAQAARKMLRANRLAVDLKWRQLPDFARTGRDTEPTVYYLAPHLTNASGGVRNIYRHVDLLNAMGIAAAVVHDKPHYRCTWFANQTRVLDPRQFALAPRDVLVLPEFYGPGLHALPPEVRVVSFNQGAYHTFDRIEFDGTAPGAPYTGVAQLAGILTVSQDSAQLLRYAFPGHTVSVARPVVDDGLFHPSGELPARRIAFLTHRRTQEREQLLHLLRAHGVLAGWELVPIAGRTEAQTAQLMRSSALFLSFSEREGFGLPPAEAMASGCHVVGYTGMGGREFFDPAYCSPVADGDLLAFARAVGAAVAAYEADPSAFASLGVVASERIRSHYRAELLAEDLRAFYAPLLQAGSVPLGIGARHAGVVPDVS
jgi:hypothetical protein